MVFGAYTKKFSLIIYIKQLFKHIHFIFAFKNIKCNLTTTTTKIKLAPLFCFILFIYSQIDNSLFICLFDEYLIRFRETDQLENFFF